MDTSEIRQQSLQVVRQIPLPTNEHLPLLPEDSHPRPQTEIVERFFALHAAAAVASGFDRQQGLDWLTREGKLSWLTPLERSLLEGKPTNLTAIQAQIESLWALAWCLRLIPGLNFAKECSDKFVYMLPNLKIDQPTGEWRSKFALREAREIVGACDLAYCLHWGIVHHRLHTGTEPPVTSYVVIERRRALEWVLSTDKWDEVSLDT